MHDGYSDGELVQLKYCYSYQFSLADAGFNYNKKGNGIIILVIKYFSLKNEIME